MKDIKGLKIKILFKKKRNLQVSVRANEIVNTARNIVQYSDLSRSSPIPLRVIRINLHVIPTYSQIVIRKKKMFIFSSKIHRDKIENNHRFNSIFDHIHE